mmetsp:Transcript_22121/g.41221  ORF Transcript_22121/g.41221 Transcript_22121/m.41221 type:complete len:245 (-) Transcript_22121:251-985(-)
MVVVMRLWVTFTLSMTSSTISIASLSSSPSVSTPRALPSFSRSICKDPSKANTATWWISPLLSAWSRYPTNVAVPLYDMAPSICRSSNSHSSPGPTFLSAGTTLAMRDICWNCSGDVRLAVGSCAPAAAPPPPSGFSPPRPFASTTSPSSSVMTVIVWPTMSPIMAKAGLLPSSGRSESKSIVMPSPASMFMTTWEKVMSISRPPAGSSTSDTSSSASISMCIFCSISMPSTMAILVLWSMSTC